MTSRRPPLSMLYAVTVVGVLATTLIQPIIPDILDEFDQPEGRAGVLVAAFPLPGIVLAPVIGVLADRYGRRNVLVPCLVVFGIGGFVSALAPTFATMLIARVFQGLGGAGLINLSVVLIGDHWSGIERTRLIGRNSAVLTASLAIAPLVSGVVAEIAGWRWAIGISSTALPLALLAQFILEDTRPPEPTTLATQLRGALEVIRRPALITNLVTSILLFIVIFGVFLTTLPVHLEEEFGYGPGLRGLLLSTPAVGSTIIAFNLGRLRTRFAARTVLIAASSCISVAALGVGLAPLGILIAASAVIYGLGDGAGISTLQDLAVSSTNSDQRGSVMAAWVSSVRLGQTIGPLGAAALFSATSTTFTMVVGAGIFAVVAATFTVAPLGAD